MRDVLNDIVNYIVKEKCNLIRICG
ncbi:uridine kinase, partial [Listeria monocytogenes]|nr:uridine kinase [Listeria monocytogenes]EAF0472922.1 uridine kinase [Listeria monocytogenes]EAG7265845.1 uridine kinase [Listeria monocytogenes]